MPSDHFSTDEVENRAFGGDRTTAALDYRGLPSRPARMPRSRDVILPPFWVLVERHGDELLAHARRMAGDQQAEDVLQDALLRALRAYPRLRHAEHLRAWLYRVTTTAAIDAHRARRRELPTADVPAAASHDTYDERRLRGADRAAAGRRAGRPAAALRRRPRLRGHRRPARHLGGRRAPARVDRRPDPAREAAA